MRRFGGFSRQRAPNRRNAKCTPLLFTQPCKTMMFIFLKFIHYLQTHFESSKSTMNITKCVVEMKNNFFFWQLTTYHHLSLPHPHMITNGNIPHIYPHCTSVQMPRQLLNYRIMATKVTKHALSFYNDSLFFFSVPPAPPCLSPEQALSSPIPIGLFYILRNYCRLVWYLRQQPLSSRQPTRPISSRFSSSSFLHFVVPTPTTLGHFTRDIVITNTILKTTTFTPIHISMHHMTTSKMTTSKMQNDLRKTTTTTTR